MGVGGGSRIRIDILCDINDSCENQIFLFC